MRFISFIFLQVVLSNSIVCGTHLQPRTTSTIPDYVNKYAPLVYLDHNELYLPSDIQAQLKYTYAALNFTAIDNGPSPLLLSNLDQLNSLANCTAEHFDGCPLFLTSKANVATYPSWLHGVLPVDRETIGATSCAIIVNDRGDGNVDAFYMYFYAFNLGLTIDGSLLGNHVGDWEHTMLRFKDGKPTAMWFSQHDNGQAFTYEAVSKHGLRPLAYSGIGGHANYAVPGAHSRNVYADVVINDTTSAGPLWDPTLSAYYYTYTPISSVNGTFIPSEPSTPIDWLYYLGCWGDEQYPDSDPRQNNFLNVSLTWKWESGPTGPLDKDLNRTEVCPDNGHKCTVLSALPASSGSIVPVTVNRPSQTSMSKPVSTTSSSTASTLKNPTTANSASSTGSSAATPTGAASYHLKFDSLGIGLGLAGALVAIL